MPVTCNPKVDLKAVLSLQPDGAASAAKVAYNQYNRTSPAYDATSTPPVNTIAADEITLGAGITTLDLTAIAGQVSGTVDFTGKKIVIVQFKAPSANVNAVTIAKGASNGYELQSTHSIIVRKGGTVFMDCSSLLAAVSGTVKNLDISSGNSGDKLQYVVIGG